MIEKIYESELKVMELVWENEPVSAKELSLMAEKDIGWNKNTTYTVIGKLEKKGFIRRGEPGFICTSLVSKQQVQKNETDGVLNRLFNGSKKALFSALLEDEALSAEELAELRDMIEKR